MSRLKQWFAGFLLLGACLGCPGALGDAFGTPQDKPFFGFGWYSQETTETTAGCAGMPWAVGFSPSGLVSSKWYLTGAGTLTSNWSPYRVIQNGELILNEPGNPKPDLTAGWYVPPVDVPPEGLTVTIGVALQRPDGGWDRSPDFPVKVVRRTQPMQFEYRWGAPGSLTFRAGESYTCPSLVVDPVPLGFAPRGELIPSIPGADAGELTLPETKYLTLNWVYKAPATLAAPMDVTLRITAWDPWAKQDRTVDFLIHLVK